LTSALLPTVDMI